MEAFSNRTEGFLIFMINWAIRKEKCKVWRFSWKFQKYNNRHTKKYNFPDQEKGDFSHRTDDFHITYLDKIGERGGKILKLKFFWEIYQIQWYAYENY